MGPFGTKVGALAMPGAVLLLGGWFAYGLVTESGSDAAMVSAGPEPELELMGSEGSRTTAVIATGREAPRTAALQPPIAGRDAAPADRAVLGGSLSASIADAPSRPPAGFSILLDRVFAPSRSASSTVVPAVAGTGGTDDVPGVRTTWGGAASAAPSPMTAAPVDDAEPVQTRIDARTEKAYHEQFVAVAAKDAQELERQAAVVLREDGDDCKKVAMLRVLYDTDRLRAMDYFAQVVSSLPDRPRPEGDSVPAFAVGYLGKRLNDPAVKGMVERIACSRYGNLSTNLQTIAARALLATATPADLQRYAEFPAFQAAAAAGTESAQ